MDKYAGMMNRGIKELLWDVFCISWRSPLLSAFAIRTMRTAKRAAKKRLRAEAEGIQVPPYMILSITKMCNLRCKGCYARAQHRLGEAEMSDELAERIISDAYETGVSMILLAGGEPLLRRKVIEAAGKYTGVVFPVFTNGMAINMEYADFFRGHKNIIPVLSLEGAKSETDWRRGKGVYERLTSAMAAMKKRGIFFGASVTVTRNNFDAVTSHGFIENLQRNGCRLLFFIEYVPFEEGTEDWVITSEQRELLISRAELFRKSYKMITVVFPGDEEKFGGCLSSGRGFVHVSSGGRLEPCPFAPFSDADLNKMPLMEALKSAFLKEIRSHHNELMETQGGCALWEKREWVQSLLMKENSCTAAGKAEQ